MLRLDHAAMPERPFQLHVRIFSVVEVLKIIYCFRFMFFVNSTISRWRNTFESSSKTEKVVVGDSILSHKQHVFFVCLFSPNI